MSRQAGSRLLECRSDRSLRRKLVEWSAGNARSRYSEPRTIAFHGDGSQSERSRDKCAESAQSGGALHSDPSTKLQEMLLAIDNRSTITRVPKE